MQKIMMVWGNLTTSKIRFYPLLSRLKCEALHSLPNGLASNVLIIDIIIHKDVKILSKSCSQIWEQRSAAQGEHLATAVLTKLNE